VARILIVGYGLRPLALARAVAAAGQLARLAQPQPPPAEPGIEPLPADPLRLGTVGAAFAQVALACWMVGEGPPERAAELHGPRLEGFVRVAVDSGARGIACEPPPPSVPGDPAAAAARLCERHALGFALLDQGGDRWAELAVERLLALLAG